MTSSETTSFKSQPALAAVCGLLFGCAAYAVALAISISLAPRRSENIREIVDLSWPIFATLPSLLAFVTLPVAIIGISQLRTRIYLFLSFSAAVGACSYFALELLRRVYIGKF